MTDTTKPTTDDMIAAIESVLKDAFRVPFCADGPLAAALDFIRAHPADSRGTPVGLDSCHARGCASWWCVGCGRLFTGGSCGKCVEPKRRDCTCKVIAPTSAEDALDGDCFGEWWRKKQPDGSNPLYGGFETPWAAARSAWTASRFAAWSEVDAIELELRQGWWLNHRCSIAALYGDDGEMQCNACMKDFKRTPLDELRAHVAMRRSRAMEKDMTLLDEARTEVDALTRRIAELESDAQNYAEAWAEAADERDSNASRITELKREIKKLHEVAELRATAALCPDQQCGHSLKREHLPYIRDGNEFKTVPISEATYLSCQHATEGQLPCDCRITVAELLAHHPDIVASLGLATKEACGRCGLEAADRRHRPCGRRLDETRQDEFCDDYKCHAYHPKYASDPSRMKQPGITRRAAWNPDAQPKALSEIITGMDFRDITRGGHDLKSRMRERSASDDPEQFGGSDFDEPSRNNSFREDDQS